MSNRLPMGTDEIRMSALGQSSFLSKLASGSQSDSFRISEVLGAENQGMVATEKATTITTPTRLAVSTGTATGGSTGGSQTILGSMSYSDQQQYLASKFVQAEIASGGYTTEEVRAMRTEVKSYTPPPPPVRYVAPTIDYKKLYGMTERQLRLLGYL